MTAPVVGAQGRRVALLTLMCSLIAYSNGAAAAEAWPVRPLTAIVPFGAGSASDVVPRVVLDQVSKQLGQPIVVENRVGAGGTLGANIVAKAQPDGYTMLATGALAAAHALYPTLPYSTLLDFAPVIPLGQQPLVLVTAPSKGFKTLGDLIATAKAKPGTVNFASAGLGSPTHLAAERLRISAGFEAQHIAYRGSAEAITDVIAGRVDFYLSPVAPALPLITDGKLVALSVSTSKRAAALPQVATTAEAGLADAAYDFWVGLYLPAKTPRDIIAKLHGEAERALQARSVLDRLITLGVEPMPMSLEQFDGYFRNEVAANVSIVKAANIPPQR
jgi:tripartite-type tricarboxylate transporter receptor subunit TctC